MFYSNNTNDTRQVFFLSWAHYCNKEPLSPLEAQIVDVIIAHPEYHALLSSPADAASASYSAILGETNPFLHMGLHLALREQIQTDRPKGIADIYQRLLLKYQSILDTEHAMMDHLSDCLWLAQKNQTMPNEQSYLAQLNTLLK